VTPRSASYWKGHGADSGKEREPPRANIDTGMVDTSESA